MAQRPTKISIVVALGAAISAGAALAEHPALFDAISAERTVVPGPSKRAIDNAMRQRIDYVVVDQRIGGVLAMVGRDTGLRIRVSNDVRGRVRRYRLRGAAIDALGDLAAAHDLDLFTYGGSVYVSAKAETTLRLVRLTDISKDRALAAIASAGLRFGPDDVREAAGGSALTFSGPPRMVAIAEAIVESIPPLAAARPPAAVVPTMRVRRGTSLAVEALPIPNTPLPATTAGAGENTEPGTQ
ncbi:MAG: hypothetical protein AAF416_04650 [Pseudomonadota bacterium]